MSTFELSNFNCPERLILTPNARLSLNLQEQFIQNESKTKDCFSPLNVKPLTAFIKECWQLYNSFSALNLKPLLSTLEINYLFKQAILETNPELPLSYSLLESVKKAWSNCLLWQLPITLEHFTYTLETETFYAWCERFIELKGERLTLTEAIEPLSENLTLIAPHLPKSILLMHFDSLSPLEELFISHLEQHLTVKEYIHPSSHAHSCCVREYEQLNLENEGLITWLNDKLKEGHKNIGVVVGELASRKESLHRMLMRHFPAHLINFSMGQNLLHYPLVSTALTIFQALGKRTLKKEQLSLLLKSSFIRREDEKASRLALSAQLETISAMTFRETAFKRFSPCAHFNDALSQMVSFNTKGQRLSKEWTNLLKVLLDELGFPGEAPLSSYNFQLLQKFLSVLDELSFIELNDKTLNFSEYLELLNLSLESTSFQPERSGDEKIHVLGLLEGLGLNFDALTLLGVNDTLLPEVIKLSPFIPPHLQKELKLPKTSLNSEILYAKRLIEKFKQSANDVCFSYFKFDESNEYRLSPLLEGLIKLPPLTLNVNKKLTLRTLENHYHSTLALEPNFVANSSLLKEQALCPFRAYAKFRLKLQTSLPPQYGLTHIERGILIHRVLEFFWRTVKTQKKLLAFTEEALNETLLTSIKKALKQTTFDSFEILGHDFKDLEEERLLKLTRHWLALEKEREAFEVISCERKETFELNGLHFSLRVDRIDYLPESDETVLIDYKSGLSSPQKWFDSRLSEPQLPLYAISIDNVDATVFFQLKPSQLAIRGVGTSALTGIKAIEKVQKHSWDEQKTKWREQLEALTEEFKNGQFQPTPSTPALCPDCDFKRLCGGPLPQDDGESLKMREKPPVQK